MKTDQNTHETKIWLMWFKLSGQKIPGIWKDVCSVQKNEPPQGGLQKWEEQIDAQHE